MTLDELLLQLRTRRLILISHDEIWPSPSITQEVAQALRKHRKGLRVLLRWSDIATCPSMDMHRRYWKYCGNGNYTCSACARLLKEVS